jgi:hypothetical protein
LRNDVSEHRSLGIVSATRGYLDLFRWETIVDQPSKPVIGRNPLAHRYDAGLTTPTTRMNIRTCCGSRTTTALWTRPGVVRAAGALRGRRHRTVRPVAVRRRPKFHIVAIVPGVKAG